MASTRRLTGRELGQFKITQQRVVAENQRRTLKGLAPTPSTDHDIWAKVFLVGTGMFKVTMDPDGTEGSVTWLLRYDWEIAR